MKDYSSAFLGMILAGVVMLVIGLGLMVQPSNGLSRPTLAENSQPLRAPPLPSALGNATAAERDGR